MRFKRFTEARSAWDDQADAPDATLQFTMTLNDKQLKLFTETCAKLNVRCEKRNIDDDYYDLKFTGTRKNLEALIDSYYSDTEPGRDARRYTRTLIKEARSAWEDQVEAPHFTYEYNGSISGLKQDVLLSQYCDKYGITYEILDAPLARRVKFSGPKRGLLELIHKFFPVTQPKITEARSAWEDQHDDSTYFTYELGSTNYPWTVKHLDSGMRKACDDLNVKYTMLNDTTVKFSGAEESLKKVLKSYFKSFAKPPTIYYEHD